LRGIVGTNHAFAGQFAEVDKIKKVLKIEKKCYLNYSDLQYPTAIDGSFQCFWREEGVVPNCFLNWVEK